MRLRPGVIVVALAGLLSVAGTARAASCRGYAQHMQGVLKQPVEALRMIERETVDRTKGLDTRPFDYLLAEARKAASVIADQRGLAEEDELKRCRNYIPPVRRVCAEAAQSLARLVAEQLAGAASSASKQAYTQAMPRCERWMGLAPLQTALRSDD